MQEVKENKDIECYRYYVVRGNILYKLDNYKDFLRDKKLKSELLPNEMVCWLHTTPSTPADFCLQKLKNIEEEVTLENLDMLYPQIFLEDINNFDYYNIEDIKNFILGIGEFKNWYDLPENLR